MSIRPTPQEIDQAKLLYNDIDDYLGHLAKIIQSQVQDIQDAEDFDSEDEDDEQIPKALQFLKDYQEYLSSRPQEIHSQLVNSKLSVSNNSSICSRLRKRFWRYSQTYQTLQYGSLDDLPECETKLDCSIQVSPSFSISLPTLDDSNIKKKLLTNETSPSVTLLKAQLEKHAIREQENNLIIIRPTKCFDIEPVEEKKVVFVVKKSTALITAPKKEEEDSTIDEKSEVVETIEKVLSDKRVKKNKKNKKKTIDNDFISNFLAIAKVGFSRSQLHTLLQSQ